MTSHADPEKVQSFHQRFFASRERMVDNCFVATSNLALLTNTTFNVAACEHALGLFDRARVSLRLAVDAGLAVFAAASCRPGEPVTFTLAGRSATSAANVGRDAAHSGRWEMVFHGAALLGDAAATRAICAVPKSIPLGSPTRGANYTDLWFELLHGWGNTGRVDGELAVRALAATDPERLEEEDRDAALYLRVSELEVVYQLALGDQAALVAAFATALDKHRRYWTLDATLARDPVGYVSWPLSALAEMARARGHAIDLESPYLFPARAAS